MASSEETIAVCWTALRTVLEISSATVLSFPGVKRMSVVNYAIKDMWRISLGVYVALPELKAGLVVY